MLQSLIHHAERDVHRKFQAVHTEKGLSADLAVMRCYAINILAMFRGQKYVVSWISSTKHECYLLCDLER